MSNSDPIKSGLAPSGCLLQAYQQPEHYCDSFSIRLPGTVRFADYVTAFYCSRAFRPERWLLALWPSMRAGDAHARALAEGHRDGFAAWLVEARRDNELLLVDRSGRTRSWLMASPKSSPQGERLTTLYFGSAVCDVALQPPWWFKLTRGFHVRYSRRLLASAVRKLPAVIPPEPERES
ncbi:MAG: hypothetical protein AAFY69_05260 [Pseudomonadota bacterium]